MPLASRQFIAGILAVVPTVGLLLLNGVFLGPAFSQSPWLFWLFDVLQFVIVPAVSLALLGRCGRLYPSDYGLGCFRLSPDVLHSLKIYVGVAALFTLGYPLAKCFPTFLLPFSWMAHDFFYDQAIPGESVLRWVTVLYLAVSAGFVEETMFRGLPLLLLSEKLSPRVLMWVYPPLTALLFSGTHWEQGSSETAAMFLLGVGVGVCYMRVMNLWPFIVGHAATDLLAFGKFYGS
jgi:membrane protease YdiL (CAAX protease family)